MADGFGRRMMLHKGRSASGGRSNLGAAGRVELKGLNEYTTKLMMLGDSMVHVGCVRALAPGANLMRDAARMRAPVLQVPDPRRRAGTLRNAIQAMRVSKPGVYAVTYVVGIKLLSSRAIGAFKRKTGRDGKFNPEDPYYGTILEFGKTPRTRRPFLKPAFQVAAEPAVRLSFDHLKMYTDAAIRRIARGGLS
jgi:hypothetical protein